MARIRGAMAVETALEACVAKLRAEPQRRRSMDEANVARMYKSPSLNAVQLSCETDWSGANSGKGGKGGGAGDRYDLGEDDGPPDDLVDHGSRTPLQTAKARINQVEWENSLLREHALTLDDENTALREKLRAVAAACSSVPQRQRLDLKKGDKAQHRHASPRRAPKRPPGGAHFDTRALRPRSATEQWE